MTARPRRIVVRIYVAWLVVVLGVSATLDLVRRDILEPSQQRGTLQLARLVAAMAAESWTQGEGLEHQAQRLRTVLDADVTVFAMDGTVRAANVTPPMPPLPEHQSRAMMQGEAVVLVAPRTTAAPINVQGARVGYVVLSPRAPQVALTQWLAVWALVCLIVGAAALLLARSMARPLAHLTRVARSFGEGNLGARAQLTTEDEFGELGRAFDEMAERTAHLVRAQKELLANVSHELRTPLSRLRVALDLAIERGDERRMELLTGNVQDDLRELEEILSDVLATARLDLSADRATATPLPLKPVQCDVRALLDDARTRFARDNPDRTLILEADGVMPPIHADPVMFRRALGNLLENAARYSDAPGTITLRAAVHAGHLRIDVVDQGIGISAADLASLFQPFFRADRSRSRARGGVGLGLVLARRIVEAHGGTITVESVLERGTTFTIHVPAGAV